MQSRADEVWQKLEEFISDRSVSDVILAIKRFEENAQSLLHDLRNALLECDKKAAAWRDSAEKGQTEFIAFSFLDSSVLTGKFDLRIDFLDSSFITDIAESDAYFSYTYLKPIFDESVAAICSKAEKAFVRFREYERDAIAAKYKNDVLYAMVNSVCSLCLLHPEMVQFWPRLTLAEGCCFTYGRLFSGQQLFLKVPKRRGAAPQ